MRARRVIAPLCLIVLAVTLAACGEKKEDLSPATTTATATSTTPTTTAPIVIPISREVAVVSARNAATDAVPKGFTVKAGDWHVSCRKGSEEKWSCRMRGGRHCGGVVIVRPIKVRPGGAATASPGAPPVPDASGIRCLRRSGRGP